MGDTESALCVNQSSLSIVAGEGSVRWREVIVRIVADFSTVASLRVSEEWMEERRVEGGRVRSGRKGDAISLPIVLDGELVAPVAGVTEH